MWERNLQDLIRGLRANKNDEAKFIASAIDDIRQEVKSKDMEVKAGAVLKLTYLEMLGYDMSWASFHVVEVMSSPKFHLKSMGYLAAAQSFQQDTDVLMLVTNTLKKDLASNPADVALTLNGLSQIITTDLARDLSRELVAMLNHSRAQIRKRAVLIMYKVFMKYPDSLVYGTERLKEKLEDPDIGVVSATVNVLCELARHNPKDYLSFAPPLFHILTTSSNNWMLIKIIKLFGILAPYEPRLIKKLQPPITDLISTTPAISLLYECVHTCIIGNMLQGSAGYSLAKTCVEKLAKFLEDDDQNLKYIALLALVKIVPSHPHLLSDYESRILSSIDDQDLSIRMRALDLISAMVNQYNLQSIIQQLLSHLARPDSSLGTTPTAAQALSATTAASVAPRSALSPIQSTAYRKILAEHILSIGGSDVYAHITDFEWYISVLVDLAYVSRSPVGVLIRDQMVDVAVRVRQVRRYAVQLALKLLADETFVGAEDNLDQEGEGCQEVLWAAAWICGEYASEYPETRKIIPTLLQPSVALLPPEIVAEYITSVTKIFGTWVASLAEAWDDETDLPEVRRVADSVVEGLRPFASNPDFEVQERAANTLQLFAFVHADLSSYNPTKKVSQPVAPADLENGFVDGPSSTAPAEPNYPKSLYILQPLFATYTLNPVAAEAQASIAAPDGLDVDAWIIPKAKPVPIVIRGEFEGDEKKRKKKSKKGKERDEGGSGKARKKSSKKKEKVGEEEAEMTLEEQKEAEARALAKARRMEMLRDDPYYIMDDPRKSKTPVHDVDSIPVVRLDDLPSMRTNASPSPRAPGTQTPPTRRTAPQIPYSIDRGGEMPPDAIKSSAPPPALSMQDSSSSQQPKSSPLPTQVPTPPLHNLSPSAPVQVPTPPPAVTPYELDDDATLRPSTPELIKVTKVKKSSGKKKKAKDRQGGTVSTA